MRFGHLVRMLPGGRPGGDVPLVGGPGKTQDTPEGLCLSAGMGTPRDPPRRSGWGDGSLGFLAQAAAPVTRHRTSSGKWMDGS